jgi:flagellar capping protein FliD
MDVTSTVNAILAADSAPLTQLQNQESTLNAQASALRTIESDLETLQASVRSLNDVQGAFSKVSVSSSGNDVVSATCWI